MKTCPRGHIALDDDTICPHCGYRFTTTTTKPGLIWSIVAFLVLLVLFLLIRPRITPQPMPVSPTPFEISTAVTSSTSTATLSTDIQDKTVAAQPTLAMVLQTQTAVAMQASIAHLTNTAQSNASAQTATARVRRTETTIAQRTVAARTASASKTAQAYRTATAVALSAARVQQTANAQTAMTALAKATSTAQARATQVVEATRAAQTRAAPTPTPRPITCSISVDQMFTSIWLRAGGIVAGCPIGSAYTRRVAYQEFQNGIMLWRASPTGDAGGMIYVLYESGAWREYRDEWVEGMPASGGYTASSGLVEPQRGFGLLWRRLGGPDSDLGWALSREQGSDFGILQDFGNNAVIFQFPEKITAFMPDGKKWSQ